MMKLITAVLLVPGAGILSACDDPYKAPPTQVVYRFDDHRYLELKGYSCQGALTYVDTRRKIRSQIYEERYRIFTKTYIHPSERYIAVMSWGAGGFAISKDYGKNWTMASYAPGGGAKQYGDRYPSRDDIESFTVVNDQGFVKTLDGDLYISSQPFDDPRLLPGGEGIPYSYRDYDGSLQQARLKPGSSGLGWGEEYTSWNSVNAPEPWIIFAYKPNWQNIPNKVPEVENYTGWSRMQCDPDLGLGEQE